MRNLIYLFALVAFFGCFNSKKVVQEPDSGPAHDAPTVVNGTAVDSVLFAVYDGQEVRFCCGECQGKFEADEAGMRRGRGGPTRAIVPPMPAPQRGAALPPRVGRRRVMSGPCVTHADSQATAAPRGR